MYNVCALLDAKYVTCWVTEDTFLFVTLFIYDSTSRRYNPSFTMSSDPLMSYLGAVLGSLLLPNAGR
jgi:hypothetical protein